MKRVSWISFILVSLFGIAWFLFQQKNAWEASGIPVETGKSPATGPVSETRPVTNVPSGREANSGGAAVLKPISDPDDAAGTEPVSKTQSVSEIIESLEALPPGKKSYDEFQKGVRELAKNDLMLVFDFLANTTAFPMDWRTTSAANYLANRVTAESAPDVLARLQSTQGGQALLANSLVSGELFSVWHDDAPGQAMDALSQLSEPAYRAAIGSSQLLRKMVVTDSAGTFDFVLQEGYASDNWGPFHSVARISAKENPAEFARNLEEISEGPQRNSSHSFKTATEAFAYNWLKNDVEAALNWVDLRPTEMRDQLIKNSWNEIAEWDPEAAMVWVSSIQDQQLRENLIKKLERKKRP